MSDKSYINWSQLSDGSLSKTIGGFIKHHRLAQNLSQDQVSVSAGISRSTLSLLERGESVNLATLIQVLRVLDLLHIMNAFKIEDDISPLAYAKLKKKQKKRARSSSKDKPKEDLGW